MSADSPHVEGIDGTPCDHVDAADAVAKHREVCEGHNHPGATYNPWHDQTWCLCGKRTYPGDTGSIGHRLADGATWLDKPEPRQVLSVLGGAAR